MATTREQIRELAERLKDEDAQEVLDYMRWLIEERDTDPLSDQERADLDEAEKERARGGGESLAKVKPRPWLMRYAFTDLRWNAATGPHRSGLSHAPIVTLRTQKGRPRMELAAQLGRGCLTPKSLKITLGAMRGPKVQLGPRIAFV